MTVNKSSILWISLLEVKPAAGNKEYEGIAGAYVHGVVTAKSADDALIKLGVALKELGFDLVEAQDTEPFDDRILLGIADENIKRMAQVALRTETTQFDEFRVWSG